MGQLTNLLNQEHLAGRFDRSQTLEVRVQALEDELGRMKHLLERLVAALEHDGAGKTEEHPGGSWIM